MNVSNFVKLVVFTDEVVFNPDEGVNVHNTYRCSVNNLYRLIEKSLNSLKIIVWAAIGNAGVIHWSIFSVKMLKEIHT